MWSLYRVAGPLDTPGRDLTHYQSCYRRHGHDGHRLDEWVVIADHSADPFIADSATAGTRVGIAIHGAGSWKPYWVAPTPADFVTLLTCFTEAYVVERANRSDDEDDYEIWPPAYHERLAALLRDHAPGVDAAAFLDYLRQ